jgi:trans-2,3-dihydro-3-hydroxyanthranilate isomerase
MMVRNYPGSNWVETCWGQNQRGKMMNYKYYICDVFTDQRFGGNQLAVLPDARGLNDTQMQQIAREFNFSESTFVFPPDEGHTRKVQIFTPTREVPFAGHPNIGTAFVLASCGELEEFNEPTEIVFEEKAGLVAITLRKSDQGIISCELKAPQVLTLGKVLPAEMLATAVSLSASEIVTDTHPPMVASVGLPFLMVELRDQSALEKARINPNGFEQIAAQGVMPDVHVYVRSHDEFDIRARMFAPHDGVPEDPATGSANCALAGLLGHFHDSVSADFEWQIAQGVEMGRPSLLHARAEKKAGNVLSTWIGGTCVMVSEGHIYVD